MTSVAGAAEPLEVLSAGPGSGVERAEAHHDCANCGTHLQGDYCHACGQRAHLHNKLRHLLHEMAEGVAHFDGRLWRTLPLLAFRPGRLSRDWMAGKRVRYVAPLHVFLFAVFLLFIIPTFTGRPLLTLPRSDSTAAVEGGAASGATPGVYADLSDTPLERLNENWKKARKNPQFYGYKIETLAYKLSFVVVPVSMAILWLLLLFKRGYSLYDHGVVALYGVGFLVLMIAVSSLFPPRISDGLRDVVVFAAAIHAVVHLHDAYGLSWFGSVVRGALLGIFSALGFGLFIGAVYALGVFV